MVSVLVRSLVSGIAGISICQLIELTAGLGGMFTVQETVNSCVFVTSIEITALFCLQFEFSDHFLGFDEATA